MLELGLKEELKERFYNELTKNILPFWMNNTIDNEKGGFYGLIMDDMEIKKDGPKGLVLCARILWTFSTAYRVLREDKYLIIAERAYEYLVNYFWDKEYSGAFWMLDYKGKPIDTKKQIYGEAFAIYGLSEFYRATKRKEALDKAIELYRLLEKYSYDKEFKGYFEAFTREWELSSDMRLLENDLNSEKTMNTHLHVLEAYTSLYRVWKDKDLRKSLKEIIEVILKYIVDKDTYHFKLYFDKEWNSKEEVISYGHDIEGSWLLLEAAKVLGDKNLISKTRYMSSKMAQATYQEGRDNDGALPNEATVEGIKDGDKFWWVEAEAVVGFFNAYQLTGKEYFLEASQKAWRFIDDNIIDKVNGEWFKNVTWNRELLVGMAKVDPWKCPYHNSRMCFELMERLKKA